MHTTYNGVDILAIVLLPPCNSTACLAFCSLVRQLLSYAHRLIQLSSPNLNYLIGIGAILLYLDAYLLVSPTTDQTATTVKCNASYNHERSIHSVWVCMRYSRSLPG